MSRFHDDPMMPRSNPPVIRDRESVYRIQEPKIMNEYEAMIKHKTSLELSARRMRNALLAQDLREIEKARPQRPRFHFQIRLPRFSRFRLPLRRQTLCASTQLNAR